VGGLKDEVHKTNPHNFEGLRNKVRREISTISGELQKVKNPFWIFGPLDYFYSGGQNF
jgi:hypothetical protein